MRPNAQQPEPQRVVIDARSVSLRQSGIGNYTKSLIEQIVPLAQDLRFTVLRHPDAPRVAEAVDEIVFPGETKSTKTVFSLGRAHRFEDHRLYHSPADLIPLGIACPWVVTIHDLMWIEAPELASAFWPVRTVNAAWYRWNIERAVRGARRVIAISHATRNAIERVYPEHARKVRVVQHGVDPQRFMRQPALGRHLLDDILPGGERFALIVGQGSPYKNQPRMIRAFVRAMNGRSDHKLVVVRRFSRIDREMSALLREPEVARLVVTVPHVSEQTLLALYQHASMLLFASCYEGFGMPALEAMGLGTPVIASKAEAVVEVTGDAALRVDAFDEHDIAENIRRLANEPGLADHLRERGARRVECFSWRRCAEQTLDVYRDALSE